MISGGYATDEGLFQLIALGQFITRWQKDAFLKKLRCNSQIIWSLKIAMCFMALNPK